MIDVTILFQERANVFDGEQVLRYPFWQDLINGVSVEIKDAKKSITLKEGYEVVNLSGSEALALLPIMVANLLDRGKGEELRRILESTPLPRPTLTLAKLDGEDSAALYLDGKLIWVGEYTKTKTLLSMLGSNSALLPNVEEPEVAYPSFLANYDQGGFPDQLEDATKYNVGRFIHRGDHYVTIYKDGAKVATYSNEMIAHISEILKEEKDKQP